MLNQECVRALLIHIDNYLQQPGSRKFKVKHHLDDPELAEFTRDEILAATHYLVDSGWVITATLDKKRHAENYHIIRLSPNGYRLLQAINDDTRWNKVKNICGDIVQKTAPQLLAALGSKLFL